jgi:phosphatidylglycerol:prolipoprotein diacylglycerol transferase
MHPALISLPEYGFVVQAARAMMVCAVLLGIWLAPLSAERFAGIDRRRARWAVIVVAVVALAAGRVHYIANHGVASYGGWAYAFIPWKGGGHMASSLTAAAIALVLVSRRFGFSLGAFADGVAPVFGLCIAVNRIGCFLQGCCIGTVCDHAWCVPFPKNSFPHFLHIHNGWLPPDAPRSLAIHPLQLYFALAGLLASALAVWVARHKRYDGQVALVTFVAFWASTAFLEGLRAPNVNSPMWGPFEQLQWLAIGLALISFAALLAAETLHRGRAARSLPA